MDNKQIYFDYNATAPILPQVIQGMSEVMSSPLNASSIHGYGRSAKRILEQAREKICAKIGADNTYQLIFTSSGTEANNLALRGLANTPVVCTTIEHPSVLHVLGQGLIPVDSNGIVRLTELDALLANAGKSCLLSIILANNEVGVIQPIEEIIKIVKKHNCLIHCDATQAFSKIDLNITNLGLDLVTISAHKIGGPQGAAALIYKKNLELTPLMIGGGQEHRVRPGTQNLAAIHGFGIAADLIDIQKYSGVEKLRNHLEQEILSICPSAVIFAKDSPRLPNTSSFTMPDVGSETQLIHFDTNGFAISAGSACSSGRVDLPVTQMGMGFDESIARCAIRVSLGLANTKEEIEAFIRAWKELYITTHNKLVA